MSFDLREMIDRHQGQQLSLLSEYINPQMAKPLKTIGFDAVYVRGQGAPLWDDRGNDYLDMLSGFGVFAVGRSHPKVKEAIHGRDIIKLIPPLVFDQADADRFIEAFDQVLAAVHRFPGPIWEVGSRLAKAALR